MAAKLFILSALVLCSIVAARVTRDAPSENLFSELFDNAKNFLEEANQNILKALEVENNEQLQQKAIDQTKALAGKLDVWANDIKTETESLKDNEQVKALRDSIDKNIEEFKLKNPDTAADIQSFVEKAKKGADEIISKVKSIKESKEAQNVENVLKKLGETSVTAFQNVQKEIEKSLKQ